MIKILHTADIHLDAPLKSLALRDPALRDTVEAATRTALSNLVDLALSQGVAALLIAGDLFDGRQRSASTAAFLIGQLDRLRTAGIAVFYIKGNHDAENPITGALELPDNVHVFGVRNDKVELAEGVWIHGVSFAGRHAPQSLLANFAAPQPDAINIAMLHSSLGGAAGHDDYAPCSVSELQAMGFDYWALGHVHGWTVHSTSPWVVMPGTPQGRDIGEAGPKFASLITIEEGRLTAEPVATSVVEFFAADLDVSGVQSDDDLRQMLRAFLGERAEAMTADAAILRLSLVGRPAHHWQILRDRDVWAEQIVQMMQDTGRLWLDKLVIALEPPSGDAPSAGAVDELAAIMGEIAGEAGFEETARREVEEVLQGLPAEVRAQILPDAQAAEAFGKDLTRSGAALVLARMKGAGS